MAECKNIAAALAKAQTEMGKALKSANNPHFKTKYADLESVLDACLSALNSNGIAVIQPLGEDELGMFSKTVFVHSSGETLECRVPLIIGKKDMQGYGSAVTYARRYGLMSMAGIAPEDDDGNAAAAAAPKPEQRQQEQKPKERNPREIADWLIGAVGKAKDMAALEAIRDGESKAAAAWQWLEDNDEPKAGEVMRAWNAKKNSLTPTGDGDQIPY